MRLPKQRSYHIVYAATAKTRASGQATKMSSKVPSAQITEDFPVQTILVFHMTSLGTLQESLSHQNFHFTGQ